MRREKKRYKEEMFMRKILAERSRIKPKRIFASMLAFVQLFLFFLQLHR